MTIDSCLTSWILHLSTVLHGKTEVWIHLLPCSSAQGSEHSGWRDHILADRETWSNWSPAEFSGLPVNNYQSSKLLNSPLSSKISTHSMCFFWSLFSAPFFCLCRWTCSSFTGVCYVSGKPSVGQQLVPTYSFPSTSTPVPIICPPISKDGLLLPQIKVLQAMDQYP